VEFGVWMPARVDAPDIVACAERVGFHYAHLYDAPMLYADTFVCMALCAERTATIKLGQGVTNGAARNAVQMACSVGTIEKLAPRRTFVGLGSGYSAMAAMGHPPMPMAEFASYLRVLRALLRGESAEYTQRGRTTAVKMIHDTQSLDPSFVALGGDIPLYVAAAGPKAFAVAGELADGLILGAIRPTTEDMARIRAAMQVGADRVGRRAEDIPILLMANIYVMDRGETFGNDRMKRAVVGVEQGAIGCFALGHRPGIAPGTGLARNDRIADRDIPDAYRDLALAERRLTGAVPSAEDTTWYLRAYDGHGWRLRPELLPHVTEEMLNATALIGSADEILATLKIWEHLGITTVGPELQDDVELGLEMTERFGSEVISRY
jgi:alkanesulfonate monooxygenase SsuD/methylene tetrahydromethanopterin reductase-like flavin-dependent oxidoreductase (luciferase family)